MLTAKLEFSVACCAYKSQVKSLLLIFYMYIEVSLLYRYAFYSTCIPVWYVDDSTLAKSLSWILEIANAWCTTLTEYHVAIPGQWVKI